MDRLRRPPVAGAACSLLAALLVLAPFVLPDAGLPTIAEYYDSGLLGGWSVLVLALVSAVAFASGSQGRTEHDVVAGATLVFALLSLVLAVYWALGVPYEEVIVQMTRYEAFSYHRHALIASTAGMVVSAVWYVYALDLV